MMQNEKRETTKPGVFNTIATGFDFTTKHLWLTLLPIILDTFFWLGPRLSLRLLLEQVAGWWQQVEATAVFGEQLLLLAPNTNLFTSLSVPLVGVPVLWIGMTPEKTPLEVSVVELQSVGSVLGLFVMFSLLGFLLTAVYLTAIAHAVWQDGAEEQVSSFPFMRRVGAVWGQLLLLAAVFTLFLGLLSMPFSLIGSLLFFLAPLLGMIVMVLGLFLAVWVILACFFVPQGLALDGRKPTAAIMDSVHLIRYQAPTPTLLILAVILIGGTVDQVLMLMEDGSWFTFISILAHAFVTTSLTVATFIYYRDRVSATERIVL